MTEETALKYSVVWASAGLIVDSIASLKPFAITETEDGDTERVKTPTWVRTPSPYMRRSQVFGQLLTSALLWGNGYAMVVRDGRGGPSALLPLPPGAVTVKWRDDQTKVERVYQLYNGRELTQAEIFHLQGPTLPGEAAGMSMIAAARESIGLGLTLEEFGARYFSQGSQAKVVLKFPSTKAIDKEQAKDIIATYERFHRGAANWHRPAVTSGGTEIENISIPPNDAQFLESREFQAVDVARWFRVPPHRVGIVSKQSSWGSGLAEENTAVTQYTFRPWINRMEEALTFYSAGPADAGVMIRLDAASLQRGSFDEQVKTWAAAVVGGIATPNEARRELGLGNHDDGDTLYPPGGAMMDPNNPQPQPGGAPTGSTKKSGGDPNSSKSSGASNDAGRGGG